MFWFNIQKTHRKSIYIFLENLGIPILIITTIIFFASSYTIPLFGNNHISSSLIFILLVELLHNFYKLTVYL